MNTKPNFLSYSNLVGIALCAFAGAANAHVHDSFNISSTKESNILKIELVETEAHSNQCDLVVNRLEYFSDLEVLNIETKESEFCPIDTIGARKAKVLWQLPQKLRSAGKLSIRVNGKVLTKISWPESK